MKKIIEVTGSGNKYTISTYTDWNGSNKETHTADTPRKALAKVVELCSQIGMTEKRGKNEHY